MRHSQELGDFQCGTVIGCHLCNKSSHEMSSILNIPQSAVSCIIKKCKSLHFSATRPQSDRPHKITEWGQQVRCTEVANFLQSVATDLQSSCCLQISSWTVCRELRGIGFQFHGWATEEPNRSWNERIKWVEGWKSHLRVGLLSVRDIQWSQKVSAPAALVTAECAGIRIHLLCWHQPNVDKAQGH